MAAELKRKEERRGDGRIRRGEEEGKSSVMGTGESEVGYRKNRKEGRRGGREEVSWISGAVLQRDTSAF